MPETLESPTSLRDRVQSLRLPARVDGTGRAGRTAWLPWALCLLLAACTASLAARVYTAHPAPVGAAGAAPAPTKETGTPGTPAPAGEQRATAPAAGSVALEAKGYVIPAHQIQVSPIEVSGLIKELYIEEGKRFKKNDILAVLDRTSFEADVADARASLASAEQRYLELERGYRKEEKEQAHAEMKETEEQLRQATADYRRATELRGTGGLSAQDFDQAEAQFRMLTQRANRLRKALELIEMGPREERIAAARADVEVTKARLRKAEWRLENCTIRAPVDGTILTKKAELGNLVNPLAFGATSGSVCEMADLSDLEVELDITERDVAKVAKGMPCKIRAEAYPDRIYDGTVDRLMPIANRAKGAVPVRVKVRVPKDEEGVFLKPEMGAVVSFLQPGK
jgi:multidrug resistance efflux pump